MMIYQILKNGASSQIIAGPPYKHVGVFDWETSYYKDLAHWQLPQRYEFPWIRVDGNGDVKEIGLEYNDSYQNYLCFVNKHT